MERERHVAPEPGVADRARRNRLRIWLALCALVSIGLYALAISNAVYEATSPGWLSWHVLLRKAYSIVAFALVGFVLARAGHAAGRVLHPLAGGVFVGAYSALIEVGQHWYSGARESLVSSGLDVACGVIGGALGAWLAGIWASRRPDDRA